MSLKRSIYLFGAGAALDWSGPSTQELTELVCNYGFKNKDNVFVTKVIYDWLAKSSKLSVKEINFETIINVIEDITEYWFRTTSGQINGLAFPITDLKKDVWDDLLNFKISHRTIRGTYSIKIPGADDAIHAELQHISFEKYPSPEAKYFEVLMKELFTAIQARVSEYSYITASHSKILCGDKNKEINDLSVKYFKMISENSILRLYNLNYDRVFQFIFQEAGISLDQGFNHDEVFPISVAHFNPMRVLTNINKNCIYHLHGSAFWNVISENFNLLEDYKFVHSPWPILQANDTFAKFEMEKGKDLLIGNIITGYRKSQRTSLSPFRQLFNAFDRDCYTGDELIIVGYSFGDQHINDIIDKAKEVNQNQKIKIVDPSINIEKFLFNHATKWKWLNVILEKKVEENITYIPFFGLTIYKMGFKEFLKTMVNKSDEEII